MIEESKGATNVEGTTLKDVQQAVDRDGFARLAPGVSYSGDTTVSLSEHDAFVFAVGATVDYSGSGDAVVIHAENLGQLSTARPVYYGGSIITGSAANSAIRITDTYGAIVENVRFATDGATSGIHLLNDDGFSEECEIYGCHITDYSNAITVESKTSNSHSHKGLKVIGGHWEIPAGGNGVLFGQNHGTYDAYIGRIGVNINDDSNLIDCQAGSFGRVVVEDVRSEPQGSTGTYVINFGADASGNGPTLRRVSNPGGDGYVRNNPNAVKMVVTDTDGGGNEYIYHKTKGKDGSYLVRGIGGDGIPRWAFSGGEWRVQHANGAISAVFRNGDPTLLKTGAQIPLEDLTARNGYSEGEIAIHDGSGTPVQGPCFWMRGGGWQSLVDGSTF
jgi:hypothetical protein